MKVVSKRSCSPLTSTPLLICAPTPYLAWAIVWSAYPFPAPLSRMQARLILMPVRFAIARIWTMRNVDE